MATERLDIVVSENGSRLVVVNVNKIGEAATKSGSAVDGLRQALQLLGTYLGAREVLEAVDSYTRLQNQLRLATSSGAQLAAVQQQLFNAAQRTGTSLTATVDLYSKLAISAKELGASQQQLIDFTSGVGTALAVGGVSADQASGALLQLSQALASPIVRAEEFNSVLEGAPTILRAVAQGMEGMEGSVAKLRQAVLAGSVTNKEFFEAFMSQIGNLDAQFGKSNATISMSLQKVQNAFIAYIGEADKATGVSRAIADSLTFLATNFDTFAKALEAGLITVLAISLPRAIAAARTALLSLWGVIAANPIGAALTALAALSAAAVAFRDDLILSADSGRTFGDVLAVVGNNLSQTFNEGLEKGNLLSAILEQNKDGSINWAASLGSALDNLVKIYDVVNAGLMAVQAALDKVEELWPEMFRSIFEKAYNAITPIINKMIEAINSLIDPLNELLGTDFSKINPILKVPTTSFEDFGKQIKDASENAFVEGIQNGLTAQSKAFAAARQADEGEKQRFRGKLNTGLNDVVGGGAKPAGLSDAELKKIQTRLKQEKTEYESLISSIDKVASAKLQLSQAESVLDREVKKGTLSRQEANNYLDIQRKQLQDQLDPLAAVKKAFEDQAASLRMTKDERERNNTLMGVERDLLQQGIILKQSDKDAMDSQLISLQALTKADEERTRQLENKKQVYNDIIGPAKAYDDTLRSLNQLLAEGKISTQQYSDALKDALIGYLDTQTDVGSGAARALLKLSKSYSDFGSMVENTLTDAFQGVEDAFVQLAKTGKISFKQLADSVIEDLTRMMYRMAISGLLNYIGSSIMTSFAGGAAGSSYAATSLPNYASTPGLYHSGGEAGSPKSSRVAPWSMFANAPRFHGGSNGLGVGEMAAILKKDEVVSTREDYNRMREGAKTEVYVINNAPNSEAKTTESTDGRGNKKIEVIIDEATAAAIRNPASQTHAAMKDRYGLTNTMVTR